MNLVLYKLRSLVASGDGGIDGKGIARILDYRRQRRYFATNLSGPIRHQFHQIGGRQGCCAQLKFETVFGGGTRWSSAVQTKDLTITTGSFSRDALKEAVRDGAPPIDLIDGDQLAEKLKELKLGVVTELIENVSVSAPAVQTDHHLVRHAFMMSASFFPNLAGAAGLTKTTAGTVTLTNGGANK